MRSLTWRMGCVAITLAAFVSYPRVSFGATDCSYGGAFKKPLPVDPVTQQCLASGSLKTVKSLNVDPNNPLQITEDGVSLRVNGSIPTGFFLPGTLRIDQGAILESTTSTLSDIKISAQGEFRNEGVLFLVAQLDSIRLKGRDRLLLLGNPSQLDPSTFLWADYVRLESSLGNVELNNATIFAEQSNIDFIAPKGSIILHDTTLFSIQNGGNQIGDCRFQPQIKDHVQVGVVDISDPSNVLICVVRCKECTTK